MITKAYIVKKAEVSDNKYTVRIPLFEDAAAGGLSLEDSDKAPLYDAFLAYNPGTIDSYRVGDIVYVSFEDNQLSQVIILGKFYTGGEEEATAYSNLDGLKVYGNANLPLNTSINGQSLDDRYLTRKDFAAAGYELAESITYRILDGEQESEGNVTYMILD